MLLEFKGNVLFSFYHQSVGEVITCKRVALKNTVEGSQWW